MYKYTHVFFFVAYLQGVFCWNTHRVLNYLSNSDPYNEWNPNYDLQSDPVILPYRNNKEIHFNDEIPRKDRSSRITFPDENNDYPNSNDHIDKNTHSQRFILKCIRSCPLTNEFQPVCGSDDITYYNIDLLRCVRECGDDVELQHLSPCTEVETSAQSTSTNGNVASCISSCPVTSEYNPVCGTDDVTYKNIGKLNCAQTCGVDVEVKRRLPCPKKIAEDIITTASPVETTTVNSQYFHSCMDSCLTTTEYKPVCASNGKTYYNTGKFQCAKSCGLNISIQGLGVCQINQFEETDISSTSSTTKSPDESPNKQAVTSLENLLEKIFSGEDTGDPQLDVRHS